MKTRIAILVAIFSLLFASIKCFATIRESNTKTEAANTKIHTTQDSIEQLQRFDSYLYETSESLLRK